MRRRAGQWLSSSFPLFGAKPYGQLVLRATSGGGGSPPTFTAVNKSVTRTQGGILLTITGTNFTTVTGVTISGTACTSLVILDDSTLQCLTPAKAAGTYNIAITNPDGTVTAANAIKFVNPSSIFGANLKRWYDGTYAAGAWTDESGNFDTSQSNAGSRPTATTFAATTDRPSTEFALSFDGTDDALNFGDATDIVTTAATFAFLAALDPTQNAEANALSKNYGSEAYIFGVRSAEPDHMAWGCGGSTLTELSTSDRIVTNNAVTRYIGTNNSTTSILYVNGVAQTHQGTGAITTGTADYNGIGAAMANESTTDYWIKGKFAQVIAADVVASSTQRDELDAYLRDCAGQGPADYDPVVALSPTGFWKPGNYANATGQWTASVGPNVTAGAPKPAESGGCPALVTGDSALGGSGTVSSLLGSGNHTLFGVADLSSITTTNTNRWLNSAFVGDVSQYINISLRKSGATYYATFFEWDGSQKVAEIDITSLVNSSGAGRICIIGRKTGGNLEISVNGSAFTVGNACGNTSVTTGVIDVAGPVIPLGTMISAGTWNRALSDSEAGALAAWAMQL